MSYINHISSLPQPSFKLCTHCVHFQSKDKVCMAFISKSYIDGKHGQPPPASSMRKSVDYCGTGAKYWLQTDDLKSWHNNKQLWK